MTYKEKIIQFMKIKNSYISSKTLYYVYKEDFDEIKMWSEKLCQKIYESIREYIQSDSDTRSFCMDTSICPWCVKDSFSYEDDCLECGYGKRHGICRESSSLYYKLSMLNRFSILTMYEYKMIIDDIDKQTE